MRKSEYRIFVQKPVKKIGDFTVNRNVDIRRFEFDEDGDPVFYSTDGRVGPVSHRVGKINAVSESELRRQLKIQIEIAERELVEMKKALELPFIDEEIFNTDDPEIPVHLIRSAVEELEKATAEFVAPTKEEDDGWIPVRMTDVVLRPGAFQKKYGAK